MTRVYLFIDFWNFELDWNELLGQSGGGKRRRIDWKALPRVVVAEVGSRIGSEVDYRGTNVYASVNPESSDIGLKKFFNALRSFEGYNVTVLERKSHKRPIRCRKCKSEVDKCPKCSAILRASVEKGVDTALVTGLIQMAVDDVYDIAVLGSTDADLCKAVELTQQRWGKRVFHLSYPATGVQVRNTCWSYLEMNKLVDKLKRDEDQS